MAGAKGKAEETEENAEEKADEKKHNTLSTSQCAEKANRKLASLLGATVSRHGELLPRGKLSIQFCRDSISGIAR